VDLGWIVSLTSGGHPVAGLSGRVSGIGAIEPAGGVRVTVGGLGRELGAVQEHAPKMKTAAEASERARREARGSS
jgi:hypothetical protein